MLSHHQRCAHEFRGRVLLAIPHQFDMKDTHGCPLVYCATGTASSWCRHRISLSLLSSLSFLSFFFSFSFVFFRFTLFFYFLPFFLDSARFRPLPLLIFAARCRPFWLLDAVRFRRSVVDSGRIPRGLSAQTDAVPARPLVIECGLCCPCLETRAPLRTRPQ